MIKPEAIEIVTLMALVGIMISEIINFIQRMRKSKEK